MTEEEENKLRKQIKSMSYKELLRRWRYGMIGDPMFIGEVGAFYILEMHNKRAKLRPGEITRISKEIDSEAQVH